MKIRTIVAAARCLPDSDGKEAERDLGFVKYGLYGIVLGGSGQ